MLTNLTESWLKFITKTMNKVMRILPLIFLTTVMVLGPPLPAYAKDYHCTSNLINECSSNEGSTNCANNNAETFGDENIVNPQFTQFSQVETGSNGSLGPTGPRTAWTYWTSWSNWSNWTCGPGWAAKRTGTTRRDRNVRTSW